MFSKLYKNTILDNRFISGLLILLFFSVQPVTAVERITYIHVDALGSPVAATDQNGGLRWREHYRPYGERIDYENDDIDNPNRGIQNDAWYTGKVHHEDIGLSNYGARWYDPTLGRFTGIDPVGFKEDNIHSFNRYAYVANNPYRYIDPDGRELIDDNDAEIGQHAPIGELLNETGQKVVRTSCYVLRACDVIQVYTDVATGNYGDAAAGIIPGKLGKAKKVTKSVKGLETRGVKPAPGTRVRPEGVPDGWRIRPTRGKGGTEYYNPKNPNESVRVMQGNPNSPYPNSQNPYARQRDSSGSYLDANGNRGANKSSDTHIPLDQFRFRN